MSWSCSPCIWRFCLSCWSYTKIICHSDNTQVVYAINKGRSANEVTMALLHKILYRLVYMVINIT